MCDLILHKLLRRGISEPVPVLWPRRILSLISEIFAQSRGLESQLFMRYLGLHKNIGF